MANRFARFSIRLEHNSIANTRSVYRKIYMSQNLDRISQTSQARFFSVGIPCFSMFNFCVAPSPTLDQFIARL